MRPQAGIEIEGKTTGTRPIQRLEAGIEEAMHEPSCGIDMMKAGDFAI